MQGKLTRKMTKNYQGKVYGIFVREVINGRTFTDLLYSSIPIFYNDRFETQRKLDQHIEWLEANSDVKHVKVNCEYFIYRTIELPKDEIIDEKTLSSLDSLKYKCYIVKDVGIYGEKSAPQILEESFEHVISFINREYENRKRNGERDAVMQYTDEVNGSMFFIPPGKRWKVVESEEGRTFK